MQRDSKGRFVKKETGILTRILQCLLDFCKKRGI